MLAGFRGALTLLGICFGMSSRGPFSKFFDLSRDLSTAADDLHVPIGFLNDLTQATTREAVLEIYSRWSQQIVAADRCSIALPDGADHLKVTTMSGGQDVIADQQFGMATSLIGAVFTSGKAAFLPRLDGVPSSGVKALADLGYKSIALVPLCNGTRCFGVINASFYHEVTEPGPIIAMLQGIGRCLATQLLVVDQMEGLSEMARTDALTGAGNRYDLYEQADRAWRMWESEGHPFAFMTVDLDHFKQINDTYGHDVGDAVLCAFVKRIMARSRANDSIIRTGGEEFGMLLTGTTLPAAVARAQRLCQAIGEGSFAIEGIQLMITASFGVTAVLPEDQSFNDVMKRADMALYEAKNAGRDQVVSIDHTDLAA